MRQRLLRENKWDYIARLGSGAFETISGEVVNIALISITRMSAGEPHFLTGFDVSESRNPATKSAQLQKNFIARIEQHVQLKNPDALITFVDFGSSRLLSDYATSYRGQCTGDSCRFELLAWEVGISPGWAFLQSAPKYPNAYAGRESVVLWEDGRGVLAKTASELRAIKGHSGIRPTRGDVAWGNRGVVFMQMKGLTPTLYDGNIFDGSCAAVIPKSPEHLPAIWMYASSPEFATEVRKLNQKINVENGFLVKVPFDLAHWQRVAAEKCPQGLPKPFSSDPTQWLFNGHPYRSDNPLQVAVARLLCYQWPRQAGSSFPDCPALGPDGLEGHADDDGIVALSPINREEAAATRVRALLKSAYGNEWQDGVTERQLLADAGHGGVTLEDWLRDSFFEEHCKLFHHRPFIWHIWDGEKHGFHVLVNYHRLAAGNGDGTRLLQKLATTYLGDWIARCNQEVAADKPGAARRLKAAQDLQADLRKILEGESPNDIFVRWKPLHEQAIGWAPDINDGMRLNIRPFLAVRDVGKKGAGLLRFKPNVKWDKDRGKEPQRPKSDFPWFWSCDPESNPQHVTDFAGGSSFSGERWNDLHYTLSAKRAARDKKA